jgi:hypothetical protein
VPPTGILDRPAWFDCSPAGCLRHVGSLLERFSLAADPNVSAQQAKVICEKKTDAKPHLKTVELE